MHVLLPSQAGPPLDVEATSTSKSLDGLNVKKSILKNGPNVAQGIQNSDLQLIPISQAKNKLDQSVDGKFNQLRTSLLMSPY
jgi:hypothetical protein